MLSNTLRLNFCCLKTIHILHAKIIGQTLENRQKNNSVWIHEIIRLITMKMKMKMKSRSNRYYINRCRSRHGDKYTKYKKCLSIMMLIIMYLATPKQHLKLNSWKRQVTLSLSWKKRCIYRKACLDSKFSD